MASIYKRGNIYWIQYHINGHPYRVSSKSRRRDEAIKVLTEIFEGSQMTVRKRENSYQADVFVGEKRVRASFKTKEEATAFYDALTLKNNELLKMVKSLKLASEFIESIKFNREKNKLTIKINDLIPELNFFELLKYKKEFFKNLQEFKKWRKSHESNNANVHGKQCPDEKNHEGRI